MPKPEASQRRKRSPVQRTGEVEALGTPLSDLKAELLRLEADEATARNSRAGFARVRPTIADRIARIKNALSGIPNFPIRREDGYALPATLRDTIPSERADAPFVTLPTYHIVQHFGDRPVSGSADYVASQLHRYLRPAAFGLIRRSDREKRAVEELLQSFHIVREAFETLERVHSNWISDGEALQSLSVQILRLRETVATKERLEAEAARVKKARDREDVRRARIAAMDDETRTLTERFKGRIPFDGRCVYCTTEIERGRNAHLDHIMPVSKGGLAVPENLVWACDTCNLQKRDHSLHRFLRAVGFDSDVVVERLLRLGKYI